jgi:hypothetical protein
MRSCDLKTAYSNLWPTAPEICQELEELELYAGFAARESRFLSLQRRSSPPTAGSSAARLAESSMIIAVEQLHA